MRNRTMGTAHLRLHPSESENPFFCKASHSGTPGDMRWIEPPRNYVPGGEQFKVSHPFIIAGFRSGLGLQG